MVQALPSTHSLSFCRPQSAWAQRVDKVFITVKVVDLTDVAVEFDAEVSFALMLMTHSLFSHTLSRKGKVSFKGSLGDKAYAFELELFAGLNVEESKWTNTGREVQVIANLCLARDSAHDCDF